MRLCFDSRVLSYASKIFIFIIISAFSSSFLGLFGFVIFLFSLLLLFFVFYLFRDPDQATNDSFNLITPKMGWISLIRDGICNYWEGDFHIVSINSTIIDIYSIYAPVSGVIEKIIVFDRKNRFYPSGVVIVFRSQDVFIPMIISPNYANLLQVELEKFCIEGTVVAKGQKIGFCAFGSQVHIFLPYGSKFFFKIGDQVNAGMFIGNFPNNSIKKQAKVVKPKKSNDEEN